MAVNDIDYPVTWTDDKGREVEADGDRIHACGSGGCSTIVYSTDPAERRRLAEAILGHRIPDDEGTVDATGREVVDRIYADELPDGSALVRIEGDGAWVSVNLVGRREAYLRALAAQRAHQQAGKVDDEQVDALARVLVDVAGDGRTYQDMARAAIEHLRGEA
jgi:hypothetical protein